MSASPPAIPAPAPALVGPDRAALVVRLALDAGVELPLQHLPVPLQERLAQRLATLGTVSKADIDGTKAAFEGELARLGAAYSRGMDAALRLLEGQVDPALLDKLRRAGGVPPDTDPWEALAALPPERLAGPLAAEQSVTAALALTRLPVALASQVLQRMPGADARRIAGAVRSVGDVPELLAAEIGEALVTALAGGPADDAAPRTVAAILDAGTLELRDGVLAGLDEVDPPFAKAVREVSFGFADIPERVEARDLPTVLRDVPQGDQVTAIAAALAAGGPVAEVAEFILGALPTRLSERLREAAGEVEPTEEEAQDAMRTIATAVKAAEAAGDIRLLPPA